jgi:hypothetical protein
MYVRFDKVEVFRLRRESNLAILTKKKYQIDYFELERQKKRRTKGQFHRSDLYREWVLAQKGMVDVDDNDDEAVKHSEDHTTSIKEISAYFDRLAIDNYKLAVDKIYEADQKRMIRKQRRQHRRIQSSPDPPGHRSSCFSVVYKGGMSLVL